MALQHLRSGTANKRPLPTAMSDGQLAVNTNLASPGLFFKDGNGDLVKVGPVHIGTTAPNASPASTAATALVANTVYQILTVGTSDFTTVGASANTVGVVFTASGTTTGTGTVSGQQGNEKGEMWLDTTGGGYLLKIYDGSDWRSEAGEFVDAAGDTMTGNLIFNNADIVFEGSTADDYETTLTVADPTADRTITLPNITGTVVTTGDTGSVTSTMIVDETIVNADISASAEIAVSKLANGTARQLLQTDAAGTGVEFTSNVSVPGTLAVGSTLGVTGLISASGKLSFPLGSSSAPSLFPGSDVDTGIFSPGANKLAITTNGTQRIVIDNSGNLGIGTTTPSADVHIVANTADLKIESTASYGVKASIILAAKDSTATVVDCGQISSLATGNSLGDLAFYSRTSAGISEGMRIDNNGNIRINTTGSTAKLVVQGVSGSSAAQFIQGGNTASDRTIIAQAGTGVGSQDIGAYVDGSTGVGHLTINGEDIFTADSFTTKFYTTDSVSFVAQESMRITDNGNVGIGLTNPSSKLTVKGTSSSKTVQFIQGGNALSNRSIIAQSTGGYNFGAYVDGSHHKYLTAGSTEIFQVVGTSSTGFAVNDVIFPTAVNTVHIANAFKTNGDASINLLTVGRGAGNVSTNTVLGNAALSSNSNSGGSNVAVGYEALKANTTGDQNVAVGTNAMESNTTGDQNTAVGNFALELNQTGDSNIAIGYSALRENTGDYNVAVGREVLEANQGNYNVGHGYRALYVNRGNNNVGIGYQSLYLNTTGSSNIAIGLSAGDAITTGSNNTIIGDIPGTSTLSSTVIMGAGTAERFRIDSNGRLLINTSIAFDTSSQGLLQIQGTTNSYAAISLQRNDASVAVGNALGVIDFFSGNGGTAVRSARIRASADDVAHTATNRGSKLQFYTTPNNSINHAERLTIDNIGNVGIGDLNPQSRLVVQGTNTDAIIHIKGLSDSSGNGASTFDGSGAGLLLTAYGMNTTAKFTPAIQFGSTDPAFSTTNPKVGAAINGIATQQYAADTAGGMDLAFYTTPNTPGTSQTTTERLRILSNGNVGIGSTNPSVKLEVNGSATIGDVTSSYHSFTGTHYMFAPLGSQKIYFDATGGASFEGDLYTAKSLMVGGNGLSGEGIQFASAAAADTLDDYHEGVWTPIYTSSGSGFSCTYDAATSGTFVKIGQIVYCQGRIRTDSVTPGTGALRIGGLPFTSLNNAYNRGVLNIGLCAAWGTNAPTQGLIVGNSARINLYKATATGGSTLPTSDMSTSGNSNSIFFSITYRVQEN